MRWLNEESLKNSALYYLERYAATTASLRRAMLRKLRRAAGDAWDLGQAQTMVDALIPRLLAVGYLDDRRFAEARAHSLRARGGSQRMIAAKLRAKGITEAPRSSPDDELAAAIIYAKRRRLGSFRGETADRARQQKDLAAMGRAGFSFAISKRALGD